MSREIEEARRLLEQRLRQARSNTFYGTVESVNETARTCDVRVGGIVYDEVLLFAVENEKLKGAVMIPCKGSIVLVSRIADSSRMYVAMFSEIDKILVTIGDKQAGEFSAELAEILSGKSRLRVTPQGFTMTRSEAGLKKTLGDLCDAIARLTVSTGVGPSGVPINIADFQKIKQELNNYLEG